MRVVENVLIIGGGVGGLTLATALRAYGIGVEIVDRQPHPSGSGIGIGPSGLRLLDRYGLARKLIARGTASNSILYADAAGKPITDLPYVARSADGLPSNVTLTRAALSEVLMRHALDAGVVLREGLTVDALAQEDEGVLARLSDGSSRRADLVVGADGASSRVRELVFGQEPGLKFAGQGIWRWLVPNTIGLSGGKTLKGTDTKLGLFPLPGNEIYAYLMVNLDSSEWMDAQRTRERVRELLREYTDPDAMAIADVLVKAESFVYRPLETLFVPDPWYRGRVVLLGDAAHTMTPHLASGGVMAVEDAVVLAEELGCGSDVASALKGYMRRRYERAKFIYDTSLRICQLEQVEETRRPDYAAIRGNALKVLANPV